MLLFFLFPFPVLSFSFYFFFSDHTVLVSSLFWNKKCDCGLLLVYLQEFTCCFSSMKLPFLDIFMKNNDDCRRLHLTKSNKWDAASSVILAMKRLENLTELQWTPRNYEKKKAEYWDHDLKENRAQQKRIKLPDSDEHPSNLNEDISNLSPSELREHLKTMGVHTRVRNLKHLQELYKDTVNTLFPRHTDSHSVLWHESSRVSNACKHVLSVYS